MQTTTLCCAGACRLRNYNTLMSILAAMSSVPINRLKRTWKVVPAEAISRYEECKEVSGGWGVGSDMLLVGLRGCDP